MATHFHIVALETMFMGVPDLAVPAPHTCSVTTYERTAAADVGARLADADIAVLVTVPVDAAALAATVTPRLRLIVAVAAGTDTIDLGACAARGIRVLNAPACNVDAVAEHAVALYFASRRRLMPSMAALRADAWPTRGTLIHTAMTGGTAPVRGCAAETVALVGYGSVGRRVATLLRALGMTVLVTARKGQEERTRAAAGTNDGTNDGTTTRTTTRTTASTTTTDTADTTRTPFADALRAASVVVLCCPRTPETVGLLGAAEFAVLAPDCLVVNVSRGGVVDEAALLAALRSGALGGAGVDVYAAEPASTATSPLLAPGVADEGLNLVTTPHTAWVSAQTTANNLRVLQENIDGFIRGHMVADRIRA